MLQSYVTEPNLSLGLVADIAGMTPRGLQRLLKAHGSSFRELVNDARLNYALRQLDDSNTSIVKIASDLCYREAGHFTRAFKRLTGLTPSKYRRQNSR
jgi:AraC-like DNA-binding protein